MWMTTTRPIRRGQVKTLTYDTDAVELLLAMCPHVKCQGKFLSELIRQEARIREERQRVRAALLAVVGPEPRVDAE